MLYRRTTPEGQVESKCQPGAGPRGELPPEAPVRGGEARHSLKGPLLVLLQRTGSAPDSYY